MTSYFLTGMRPSSDESQGGRPRPAWRYETGIQPSLPDVHASVPVDARANWLRRLLAFSGPGYMVAVGYMDPGNWATDIAGGAKFGYTLLVVIMLSNLMAILLQALAARLGIATGKDLAQACRDGYPRWAAIPLWLFCEAAIIACDLAEVIGTAIALNLLFGIPLVYGAAITALDALLLLSLMKRGFRFLEAFIIALLIVIAVCFFVQIVMAAPPIASVLGGFMPSKEIISNPEMLYLAIGIIGATVMPHNLYLHSSIVQTRNFPNDDEGRKDAIRWATADGTIALMLALFVNGAILVVAAAVFHAGGRTDVADIGHAYSLLAPLLGTGLASVLFGVALLASGLNSTITATLAGQVIMEGFLRLHMAPWARRLLTRSIAIVPVVVVAALYGESGTGQLLILSQIVLSMHLPFAVIPLVWFVSDKRKMGRFAISPLLAGTSWIVAAAILVLNLTLLLELLSGIR
jgi:manganese transport protein